MKIYLGTDHAGFALKECLKPYLEELGHEVVDIGAHTLAQSDDYTDYVAPVAKKVSEANSLDFRGVILGGSGQGEAMLANRYLNVRATVYYGGPLEIVRVGREHNDSNVLSLGARFLDEKEARQALDIWLAEPFSENPKYRARIDEAEALTVTHTDPTCAGRICKPL